MLARSMGRPVSVWTGAVVAALLGLAGVPAGASPATEAASSPIVGHWLSEKEKLVVEFYPCKDELCGRIVWLANPYRSDGKPKRDDRNPDPALRDRPYCGMEVIHGLSPAGDGVWEDGRAYDPKRGRSFDLEVRVRNEDEIKVRAYLGIKLLGKTEVWTRAGPEQELGCPRTS